MGAATGRVGRSCRGAFAVGLTSGIGITMMVEVVGVTVAVGATGVDMTA
jgi:hypothetical protein